MTIRTETITRGERVGYLARPADARAGVLLLPSVHGIDQYSKAYAQALAEAGLATVIWEPFPGSPPADTREQRAARLAPLTDATSLREMTWWLDLMAGELSLTKIGTAGFCLGGRYGLLLVGARPAASPPACRTTRRSRRRRCPARTRTSWRWRRALPARST